MEETRHEFAAMDNLTFRTSLIRASYDQVSKYLEILKKFYVNRYNAADKKKEEIIFSLTNTPEKQALFNRFRETYHNESITELVKNLTETHRIIEKDGKLDAKNISNL